MSSWKRILTTDDLDSVEDTTLATSDLTQTSQYRYYTTPSNASGSYLIFRGTVNNATENLLVLRSDSNSSSTDFSYAYTPSLRIGNFFLSGTSTSIGYALPQFSTNEPDGKVIVTKNFDSNSGESEFQSFDEWVGNPTYTSADGLSTGGEFGQSAPDPWYDSVLMYNTSGGATGQFGHIPLRNFRGPVFLSFGRHNGSAQTASNLGMKGVNGVPHTTDGSSGFVATRYMTLMAASMSFSKLSGTTSSRRVNVYKNGTLVCITNYFGSSTAAGNFVNATYSFNPSAASSLQRPEDFAPGDVIAVTMERSGTIGTDAHSVVLEFV